MDEEDIHIETDESFWLENVDRVKHFFAMSILPEFIGKLYTSQPARGTESQEPCHSGTSASLVDSDAESDAGADQGPNLLLL